MFDYSATVDPQLKFDFRWSLWTIWRLRCIRTWTAQVQCVTTRFMTDCTSCNRSAFIAFCFLFNRDFIPYNVIILGIERWKDRIFISTPRWKRGVPATLSVLPINADEESPPLEPYPDWDWHNAAGNVNVINIFKNLIHYYTYLFFFQKYYFFNPMNISHR